MESLCCTPEMNTTLLLNYVYMHLKRESISISVMYNSILPHGL